MDIIRLQAIEREKAGGVHELTIYIRVRKSIKNIFAEMQVRYM